MFGNGFIEVITEVVFDVLLDLLLAVAGPGKEDGSRNRLSTLDTLL